MQQKNARRWTTTEIDCLADVLADSENSYATALDQLALKKSSNNEVFDHIRLDFIREMDNADFREKMLNILRGPNEAGYVSR